MSAVEKQCTVLMQHDDIDKDKADFAQKLESGKSEDQIDALKSVILLTLNGEPQPMMMMPIIKYCIQTRDHVIKKMLLIYWEVVDKTDSSGKLLPEMILVCNNIRNDLQHPNEYIRGSTLRFISKVKYPEILESLIPAVTGNLEHRHSYVRKNAVLAVFEVYQSFPDLIPDAPDLMVKFLDNEPNLQARRNAFLMLFHCDIGRAAYYLESQMEHLATFGESFQMVALELIRKMCRNDPRVKARYLRCIFSLLNSTSNTVAYEASNSLLSLSSAPTAVRSCIATLTRLLSAESDHNIRLIILDRLVSLPARYDNFLREFVMDIMRVLHTENVDIRKKVLGIVKRLVSQRNVGDVVSFLKKEMTSSEGSLDASQQYRQLLVQSLYECASKFPDMAEPIVRLLLNYIGDEDGTSSLDILYFVRCMVQEYEDLRQVVVDHLISNFEEIKLASVFRVALWIVGEFPTDAVTITSAVSTILAAVQPLPLCSHSTEGDGSDDPESSDAVTTPTASSRPIVLADGTYAQQSAGEAVVETPVAVEDSTVTLRSLLIAGDYFLGTAICNTLTKLVLRQTDLYGLGSSQSNTSLAQAMYVMSSILRYGQAKSSKVGIEQDSIDRISRCIRACLYPQKFKQIFLAECRRVFIDMVESRKEPKTFSEEGSTTKAEVDDVISMRQLKNRYSLGEFGFEDDDLDLSKAVGNSQLGDEFKSRMNRVFQLTGYSDPVYAEACVTTHEYDIVLDILIINQTQRTLQNLSIELSTSGDLKLVERPQGHTIGPSSSKTIQANIKVSSTESGVIFGNIVYDASGLTDKQVVVMNSVHMDIMDYIAPATCTDTDFRFMWAEFEWENKVPVNTDIQELGSYVDHIIDLTNMKCLTERSELSGGGSSFLAVNMYARSVFGEDALMNVSVEKLSAQSKISGYIRIRSKTQGIALSLGDRITANQRERIKKTE